MIRIGLSRDEKLAVVKEYLASHGIKDVVVLYSSKHKTDYEISIKHEYVEWKDIIEYPYFYRLLEEIDNDCLIIVDEMMRTQNRSELTYNCAHHYLNQTEHKIIFEYFPFIEDKNDFMILLDFQDKGKYKGKSFSFDFLAGEDVSIKHNRIGFSLKHVLIDDDIKSEYEEEKERLFENLGRKDPDTIPRNLHVFVGKFKKPHIDPAAEYVARNSRFNLKNVCTYQHAPNEPKTVLDFHYRRLDFNDYLKRTCSDKVVFVSTGLPVDSYYAQEFVNWLGRVKRFAEASVPE